MVNEVLKCAFLAVLVAMHCLGQRCELASKADDSLNKRVGEPVIQGKPFPVPAMTWRFSSAAPPEALEVRYHWQWIDYPYPEHPFGAWVTSTETVECRKTGLTLEVPARTVQPRGWYQGTYTALSWSKPKFHQVEFVIVWERNCRQTVMLSRRIVHKFRDHEAVLKRSCGALEEIQFVRKKK